MIFPDPIKAIPQPRYIYLIRIREMCGDEYKIGMTLDIKKRLDQLWFTKGLNAQLIAYGYSVDGDSAELKIQDTYSNQRAHGEYFSFNCGQIFDVIATMQTFCEYVKTDYTQPKCPVDGGLLSNCWKDQLFKCEKCGYTISFDHYPTIHDRMLPMCCDEMSDDDMMCTYDRYHCIYD